MYIFLYLIEYQVFPLKKKKTLQIYQKIVYSYYVIWPFLELVP